MPSYAFLFDAEHADLVDLASFGTPCNNRLMAAVEALTPIPNAQIFWGKVIPEHLCYRLAKVSTSDSGEASARGISQTMTADMGLYKLLICDLAETLTEQPSSITFNSVFEHIGKGLVWAISLSHLSEAEAVQIDNKLRSFEPYLGFSLLDLGNPLHRHVFIEMMFRGRLIKPEGFFGRLELGEVEDEKEDLNEMLVLMRGWSSRFDPKIISWQEFEKLAPPLPKVPISERGAVTLERWEGKHTTSHRERVARVLVEYYWDNPNAEIEFSTDLSENDVEFDIPIEKLTDYLLNPDHPDGGPKAEFFKSTLGIEKSDHKFLADQITRGAKSAKLYRVGVTQYGFTHGALMVITGRNDREVVIETGWIIIGENAARLVTAYPADTKTRADLKTTESCIVDNSLVGDERWKAIHAIAHQFATKAAAKCIPTPMVVEDKTYWEGECGFGWVRFHDGRKPFVKWLVKAGLADKGYRGFELRSPIATQSHEINKAYADEYAYVANANGVKCVGQSRID